MLTRLAWFAPAVALTLVVAVVSAQQPALWSNTTGDQAWETALNWAPPIVPNGALFDVQIAIDTPCRLSSAVSVGSLRVVPTDGALILNGGASLVLQSASPLVNNGTITINPGATNSRTRLSFASTATINGVGSVQLNGASPGNAELIVDRILTNGAGHTIRGRGEIASDDAFRNLLLINDGVISADAASGQPLRILSDFLVTNRNSGILEARDGGRLVLDSGRYDQSSGGSLQAIGTGSAIEINMGATIIAGAIGSTDGGSIEVSTAACRSCAITGGVLEIGRVPITGGYGSSLSVAGPTLVNDGSIVVNPLGAAAFTGIRVENDLELSGTGEVRLNGPSSGGSFGYGYIDAYGRTITQRAGHTIRGRGGVSGYAPLINEGAILADVPGGALYVGSVPTNTGTISAVDGAFLSLSGDQTAQGPGGSISAVGAGTVLELSTEVIGGALHSEANAVVRARRAMLTDCTSSADIVMEAFDRLAIRNTLTNNGTITVQQLASAESRAAARFSGSGILQLLDGALHLSPETGTNSYSLTNDYGHTVGGRGSIGGFPPAVFLNDGSFIVGAPLGAVVVRVGAVFEGLSRVVFTIGGAAAGTEHSVLRMEDAMPLTLGGRLAVDLLADFTPAPSDRFTIIATSGPLNGEFSNAAAGQRIDTRDRRGSFRVEYTAEAVILADFGPPVTREEFATTSVAMLPSRGAVVEGRAPAGTEVEIQATEDLTQEFRTVASVTTDRWGAFEWHDATATDHVSQRFYRATMARVQ